MQFELRDQTEDDSAETDPVAPGTSCYGCFKEGGTSSLSNVFGFVL
ncbi:hypothetical protein M0R88_08175 [Halorussus gelatinilyticus]|uniref:Uncharacterized protein n=1 Tax=Halorussus gelatinilyticus TaxID=2937524 RepID=A0A8U0IMT4_9EURY|nr:hypothetical protein [Halorussus gelatinilyticus]UPW02058.1 hypothetical protein M0R88_08175 [Halorussus gelatinilyticus]